MNSGLMYNGSIYTCSKDIDCPGNTLCFFTNKTTPNNGLCGCDVEYGLNGNLCDEVGPMGHARQTTFALNLIMASFIALFVLFEMIRSIFLRSIHPTDVRITSLALCLVGLACFIMYICVGLIWVSTPGLPLESDAVTGKRRKPYSVARNVGLNGFVFFFVASALNVSILWLEVAIASKSFKTVAGPQLSRHYRIAIASFDVLVVFVLSLVYWFSVSLTPIVGMIVLLIVVAL